MIDTVRFRGPAASYVSRHAWTLERFYVFQSSDGNWQRVPVTQIENKKDAKNRSVYRVFYIPTADMMDVEINIGKLLFTYNIFNYEIQPYSLLALLRSVGRYFFGGATYYISRVDIGHVITYPDANAAAKTLESFRHSRLPGSYAKKYRHQNYADSIFYKSQGWSIKIYNKAAEMRHSLGPEFSNLLIPKNNMLRYEKTYRMAELRRIGMPVHPHKGVPIDEFNMDLLLANYASTFTGWERATTPYFTEKKGLFGLLSVIDQSGHLSEIEALKVVSRSTLARYRKEKRQSGDLPSLHVWPPEKNIDERQQQTFYSAVNNISKHFV